MGVSDKKSASKGESKGKKAVVNSAKPPKDVLPPKSKSSNVRRHLSFGASNLTMLLTTEKGRKWKVKAPCA